MKKIIVLLVLFWVSVSVSALSLREAWINMPDSLIPTLDKNLRMELVDLVDMGVKPDVKNLVGESCRLDTLTTNFLQLHSSESMILQVKLLPDYAGGDSLICMVKTCLGPKKESMFCFYDSKWKSLGSSGFIDSNVYVASPYFVSRPDSMSEEQYQHLLDGIEPKMFYFELSATDDSLVSGVSLPLVSKEEYGQLDALVLQRKFKWTNKKFNEN